MRWENKGTDPVVGTKLKDLKGKSSFVAVTLQDHRSLNVVAAQILIEPPQVFHEAFPVLPARFGNTDQKNITLKFSSGYSAGIQGRLVATSL